MNIDKQMLMPLVIFNKPVKYNEQITLYPIKMKDILSFQQCQVALTLRKDAIFQEKQLIKLEYLDFIKYACRNEQLAEKYNMPELVYYYDFVLNVLMLSCGNDANISYDNRTLAIFVNGFEVSNSAFDDLRRIIIIQNDIDFDIDEFMNIDTVRALEKAREFEAQKNKEKCNIEDYIDSLVVDLKVTEEYVSNMTIRKFWRYIKRITKHEKYQACLNGQMSGMVTFKEPLKHWMTTIEVEDRYENLKTDEKELRGKVG